MRKDLFDKMIQGFAEVKKYKAGQRADVRTWVVWDDLGFSPEEADRLESIYLARRTDKLMKDHGLRTGRLYAHAQLLAYDMPDYSFSRLQEEFEVALRYAGYKGKQKVD